MGYEKITSAGFDRQEQCVHTFKTLMQAEYNRLCEEQGTNSVDEKMVSAAFNRLLFAPIERIAALEAHLAAEASAVETLGKVEEVLRRNTNCSFVAMSTIDRRQIVIEGHERHKKRVTTVSGASLLDALAALRALTEAQSNSPASEVRE